jgi:pimeloyl-ACP methyl ester carboxylesterase
MIKAIQKTGIRQLLTLPQYEFPVDIYETEVLMLGGCSNLIDRGCYMEGDLSGIQVSRLPNWFKGFYRPGKEIANIKVPMLVMAAFDYTEMYPQYTLEVAQSTFQSQYQYANTLQLEMAEGAKHFIMWDKPEWMFEKIDQFIQ